MGTQISFRRRIEATTGALLQRLSLRRKSPFDRLRSASSLEDMSIEVGAEAVGQRPGFPKTKAPYAVVAAVSAQKEHPIVIQKGARELVHVRHKQHNDNIFK
jgi:hypothetical protein